MFKLVAVQEQNGIKAYAIHDDSDGSFDVVSEELIKRVLVMGLPIGGVTQTGTGLDGSFTYTDEFFIPVDTSEPDEDFVYDENEYEDNDDWDDEEEFIEDEDSIEDEDDYDEEPAEEDDYLDYDDDDWDSEGWVDDEYVIEDSEVDKLYALLGDEQGNLLKRYYLWTSQILFSGNSVNGVKRLSTKNTKRAQDKIANIEALRGQGKTWVYAGYLDLGYRGADTCNLCGSPLRYQHYICDAAIDDIDQMFWGNDYANIDMSKIYAHIRNGHIFPFGIECTGDFFNIDKEDLDLIKKNQRDSTDEMKFMYHILQMPKSCENVRKSFKVFEDVMDAIMVSVARSNLFGQTSRFETPLLSFYKQFKDAGMIYPRSLVSRLWHAFSGFAYPLRTTKINVMYKSDTLTALAKEYMLKDLKLRSPEERKCVDAILSTNSRPTNYMQNTLMYQFMGIYSFNPQSQKDIEGVIDSPRCRDFGGSNATSRAFFSQLTGISSLDSMKPDPYYDNYPMKLNRPRIDGLFYRDASSGCEFTPKFMVDLCLFAYYKHMLSEYNFCEFKTNINVPDIVKEDGIFKRSEEKFLHPLTAAEYIRKAQYALNNGEIYSADSLLYTKNETVRLSKTKQGSNTATSIQEAVEIMKHDAELCKALTENIQSKVIELIDELAAKHNEDEQRKRAAAIEAERLAKEEHDRQEALRAKVEASRKEVIDTIVSSDDKRSLLVLADLNTTGISRPVLDDFIAAYRISKGVENGRISANMLVSVMTVAEKNAVLKNAIDARGNIYFSILETVRKNKGTVSSRQRFRLEEALEVVMGMLESPVEVKEKQEIDIPASSSVEVTQPSVVSEEVSVEEEDTTSSEAVVAEEDVRETLVVEMKADETQNVSTTTSTNEIEPVRVSEPSNVVTDILKDTELRDMFNKIISGLPKIQTMVDAKTFTTYGFALRNIKATLKVNKRQKDLMYEMYALIK